MPDYRDYAAQMNLAVADIKNLQKLKKEIDPASCMAISVRRGVPQDNDDREDDAERRPWLTMSFGSGCLEDGGMGTMNRLIDMLIADRICSLKGWVRSGAEYAQEICKADVAAQQLLKELG